MRALTYRTGNGAWHQREEDAPTVALPWMTAGIAMALMGGYVIPALTPSQYQHGLIAHCSSSARRLYPGGASAESMGFTKEDGGYEYEAPLDVAAVADASGADDRENPGDF